MQDVHRGTSIHYRHVPNDVNIAFARSHNVPKTHLNQQQARGKVSSLTERVVVHQLVLQNVYCEHILRIWLLELSLHPESRVTITVAYDLGLYDILLTKKDFFTIPDSLCRDDEISFVCVHDSP